MTPLRVAAVVVTHNRSWVLAETLRAAQVQTRPADSFFVIDNASSDDTTALLRTEFPDVIHVRLPENLGPSGGLAHGIEAACADGFDAFWLMDDDSNPQRGALEKLVTAADHCSTRTGIIGCSGGVVRFGLVRHVHDPHELTDRQVAGGLFRMDFVLLDGSLVLRRLVDVIGFPRTDYFAMMEDVEYPLRARRAGFEVLVTSYDLMRRAHLGSTPGTALWRGYYQSRNHVRMALDFRSPTLLFGCIVRQVRFMIAALWAPGRRRERIKLRLRGVWDGLGGRMGRRVDPDSPAR
jgi:rhamnopyranosyl-N-acetylglucosaminyl-diphospho-decaprenol beta-1,3/1,4-galactofuranosyltransferase